MIQLKDTQTSLEKALDVCEALAGAPRGLAVTELARVLKQPAPTVHRLLGVLKRRGFVRQDEDTSRYSLTLKMLDMSFRLLGRSELRLHAYPVLREYVLRTGLRAFIAVPAGDEVTYIWSAGTDEVGMHTTHGREMPVHCAMYVERSANRRLSCVKLEQPRDAGQWDRVAVRFGELDGLMDRGACRDAGQEQHLVGAGTEDGPDRRRQIVQWMRGDALQGPVEPAAVAEHAQHEFGRQRGIRGRQPRAVKAVMEQDVGEGPAAIDADEDVHRDVARRRTIRPGGTDRPAHSALVPRAAQEDEPDELEHGHRRRRDVREGRGVEDGAHPLGFLGQHQPLAGELGDGPAAGIELHREGDDGEGDIPQKDENAQVHQPWRAGDQPDDEQNPGRAGAEAGEGDDGRAQGQRRIPLFVLQRVAGFVRGDPDRGDGVAAVHFGGQPQDLLARIVVIRQHPFNRLDLHVGNPVAAQELGGDLRARVAGAGADLGVAAECR